MVRRSLSVLPIAVAVVLLLSGCVPNEPVVTPPPTSDAEPVFASDEEALAAAEEAYGKYLATADQILTDGGRSPERILEFISDEVYESELEGFDHIRDSNWFGLGSTAFTLRLQSYNDQRVVAYSCDDVSGTDLVDSSGRSVVKPGRVEEIPFEVEFDVADDLRITRKEVWTGGGVC